MIWIPIGQLLSRQLRFSAFEVVARLPTDHYRSFALSFEAFDREKNFCCEDTLR